MIFSWKRGLMFTGGCRLAQNASLHSASRGRGPIYEGFVFMPFGGPFLETPRHGENTKTCILLQCWTPGVPTRQKTSYFTRVREHTPVATKAFGTSLRRVSRSGAPVATRPQPQNTTENWPQSGRDLGLVVGPPGPPRGCPERPRSPQGNAKHDGQRGFSKNY